ncbi:hypothetical protein T484DRAFT_1856744 [Baffinella frigidus]|nr:hypothetical protein T484DRAFT_1856744 [Cryptophyta sp. CCMP2293]
MRSSASGGRSRSRAVLAALCVALSLVCVSAPDPAAGLVKGGGKHAEVSAGLRAELDAFDALTAADPRNVSLRYTTGMLYQLAGQPQQVCDHLYAAYTEDPNQAPPELLFHLANNLKAIGENDAAIRFYAAAIGIVPTALVNLVLISITLDFVGRPAEAVRGFQTVLRMKPPERIESWVEIYMLSSLAKAVGA